eukprot:g70212.t1
MGSNLKSRTTDGPATFDQSNAGLAAWYRSLFIDVSAPWLLGQFENPAQYMKTWQDYLRAGVEGGTFWGGSVNHNLDVIVPYLQMFGYDLVASTKDVSDLDLIGWTADMRYDRNILSIPKSARILKVENQGLCRVKGRDAGWGVYSPAYHAFLRNSERIACQDADQAQPQFVERERDEL